MPQINQSHPNNPLGAALSSIGGSISDWSAQRRLEERKAAALKKADDLSQGAISQGMEVLQGAPVQPSSGEERALYQQNGGQGQQRGAIDQTQVSDARLRIARDAPEMLSWFDRQTVSTLKEEKRKEAFPKIEDRILEGSVQGWLEEGQGETFAQAFKDGGEPSVIMASLDQMKGDFVKKQTKQFEAQQEGQMDSLIMQSDQAKLYRDKNGDNTGVVGYMSSVHALTKDMTTGQRLAIKASLAGPQGAELLRVLENQKAESEKWKSRALQGQKFSVTTKVIKFFDKGEWAEGFNLMDQHGITPDEIYKAGGPQIPNSQGDAQQQQTQPGAQQPDQAVPTSWQGSRAWGDLPPQDRDALLTELRLLLEQGADESQVVDFLKGMDLSVTKDELKKALQEWKPSANPGKRGPEAKVWGGYGQPVNQG